MQRVGKLNPGLKEGLLVHPMQGMGGRKALRVEWLYESRLCPGVGVVAVQAPSEAVWNGPLFVGNVGEVGRGSADIEDDEIGI